MPDQAQAKSKSKSNITELKTSTSKKSASGSKKQPRLSQTLKRKPFFRDLKKEDIRYIWAAYKKGSLGIFKDNLNPQEFDAAFTEFATKLYDFHWVYLNNNTPIGFVFGRDDGPWTLIGDQSFFPWATKRMIYESTVNFINETRKYYSLFFYCSMPDKHFYERIARHGIIRRIGHKHGIYKEPAILWESKEWAG